MPEKSIKINSNGNSLTIDNTNYNVGTKIPAEIQKKIREI